MRKTVERDEMCCALQSVEQTADLLYLFHERHSLQSETLQHAALTGGATLPMSVEESGWEAPYGYESCHYTCWRSVTYYVFAGDS